MIAKSSGAIITFYVIRMIFAGVLIMTVYADIEFGLHIQDNFEELKTTPHEFDFMGFPCKVSHLFMYGIGALMIRATAIGMWLATIITFYLFQTTEDTR